MCHFIHISTYKLGSYLAHLKEHVNEPSAGIVRMFCQELLEQLNHQSRFNDHGKQTLAYCMGNFFHPHYRGILLKEYKIFDPFVNKLVSEHPTTQAFYEQRQVLASLSDEEFSVDDNEFLQEVEPLGLVNFKIDQKNLRIFVFIF